MEKIQRLEELSNKVRNGEPIGFGEALEVIEYQQALKANKVSLKDKIINFFKRKYLVVSIKFLMVKDEMKITLCKHCDHFVEVDDFIADNPCVIHLEDGEQDFNHEPELSENSMTLDEWKIARPDLFKMHKDGCIGPNSMFHSRRGKTS